MEFPNLRTNNWNNRPERRTYNYQSRHDLHNKRKRQGPSFSFLAILKLLIYAIGRFFVAFKYQISRLNIGSIRLPWFRIAVAAILIYLIFQRDLQFQVHMNAPGQQQQTQSISAQETSMSLTPTLAVEPAPVIKIDPFAAAAGDSPEVLEAKSYIRRFQQVAIAEMKKYEIPASIKMAQGLLESNAGKSRLATSNQNHFGIKCFSNSCPKGHCSNFPDDHHKDFFRKYDSPWASWRAHSEHLSAGKYKALEKHGNDYKAWANGLAELGYATDTRYAEKLIETIERYQLFTLDTP